MRVCIPTMDEAGLGGSISPHFGRAPYYTYVELKSGRAVALPNGNARYDHGECGQVGSEVGGGVGAVVWLGLGRRALGNLEASGVPVYRAECRDVAGAVAAFAAGRLRRMAVEEVCRGEGHGG